ncbi:MAG: hypothetical protein WD229_11345 [Pirellulales bacterium]
MRAHRFLHGRLIALTASGRQVRLRHDRLAEFGYNIDEERQQKGSAGWNGVPAAVVPVRRKPHGRSKKHHSYLDAKMDVLS